jgi:hypothetical protein
MSSVSYRGPGLVSAKSNHEIHLSSSLAAPPQHDLAAEQLKLAVSFPIAIDTHRYPSVHGSHASDRCVPGIVRELDRRARSVQTAPELLEERRGLSHVHALRLQVQVEAGEGLLVCDGDGVGDELLDGSVVVVELVQNAGVAGVAVGDGRPELQRGASETLAEARSERRAEIGRGEDRVPRREVRRAGGVLRVAVVAAADVVAALAADRKVLVGEAGERHAVGLEAVDHALDCGRVGPLGRVGGLWVRVRHPQHNLSMGRAASAG